VQGAPDLFSYLQSDVDENPAPGRFILTGSQQLALTASQPSCILLTLAPEMREHRAHHGTRCDLFHYRDAAVVLRSI
jgi:hypothetical protein